MYLDEYEDEIEGNASSTIKILLLAPLWIPTFVALLASLSVHLNSLNLYWYLNYCGFPFYGAQSNKGLANQCPHVNG
jgi:hypothetical protein